VTIQVEKTYKKRSGERLDYGFDWRGDVGEGGPYLDSGEDVTASAWTITPDDDHEDDVALTIYKEEDDGEKTKVWVTGGTVGVCYTLTNAVETDYSRKIRRSIAIHVIAG
jgi:hypothetical protein